MKNSKSEKRNGRAGSYSCGQKTDGYRAAMCALAETNVSTYRTSSIPLADFWRPENLIAKAWLAMIGLANCTDLHSSDELFKECGEIGYQFLHRTASACHNAGACGIRKPVLVYQLFFDRDDAAVVVRRPDGHVEYGILRWHRGLEGFDLLPWEV